jgi:hypothetical protein
MSKAIPKNPSPGPKAPPAEPVDFSAAAEPPGPMPKQPAPSEPVDFSAAAEPPGPMPKRPDPTTV